MKKMCQSHRNNSFCQSERKALQRFVLLLKGISSDTDAGREARHSKERTKASRGSEVVCAECHGYAECGVPRCH